MQEKGTISSEVENLLKKGACCGTSLSTKKTISEQYIYSEKEGWGQQTCDQLEGVKPVYYFLRFQMESLQSLKTLLQKNEYMCKLDLRDSYLCFPLSQDDRKRLMFRWGGTLYQFLCLCFGLAPAPYSCFSWKKHHTK